MSIILLIPFIILFFAGIVILQILLSKNKNKWLGLILPMVFLLISLMGVLGISFYPTQTTQMHTVTENGVIIDKVIKSSPGDAGSLLITVVVTFFVYNIPTVILLLIYAAYRKNIKKNKRLDKMKVQDL